jgi:hypothetical protein
MSLVEAGRQLRVYLPGTSRTVHKRGTARHRSNSCRGLFKSISGIILMAVMVVLSIFASNGVITTNQKIDKTNNEISYLTTKIGVLEQQWNRASSRELVSGRAKSELGLINLNAPAVVLAYSNSSDISKDSMLDRFVGIFSGDGVAVSSARAEER